MLAEDVLASRYGLPLKLRLGKLPEYLEVGVEAGRCFISLPLLLCPMNCPFKWRLEDER